jgi:hypothetical protein
VDADASAVGLGSGTVLDSSIADFGLSEEELGSGSEWLSADTPPGAGPGPGAGRVVDSDRAEACFRTAA